MVWWVLLKLEKLATMIYSVVCFVALVAAVSPSVHVVVTCSVVLFIVGLLGGFAGGSVVAWCAKAHQNKPHPPPPGAPLYDDINLTTSQEKGQELKLEENVAYGHITG